MQDTATLQQPAYDVSLMGVVKGALDSFGIRRTSAEAFTLSGHAFVINVHGELCPSGPYCWNYAGFFELLANLGLAAEELGTALPSDAAEQKAQLEARVCAAFDDGAVCSLLHLDNQLLLGHDGSGFSMAQPWGAEVPTTPARLSFGSWQEYVDGPPLTFFRFTPCGGAGSSSKAVFAALAFAVDVWRRPRRFAMEGYGMGPDGYANWLAGIDAGFAGEHGNWWNGVVWAECREHAGDYFQALAAAEFPGPIDQEEARQLAIGYRSAAKLLYRASDKGAAAGDKRGFVEQAWRLEEDCVARIEKLLASAS